MIGGWWCNHATQRVAGMYVWLVEGEKPEILSHFVLCCMLPALECMVRRVRCLGLSVLLVGRKSASDHQYG